MFKFFFKKNFVDIWENLFYVILINFFKVVVSAGTFVCVSYAFSYLPLDERFINIVSFVLILITSFVVCVMIFAGGENAVKVADFKAASYVEFFRQIPKVLKDSFYGAVLFTIVYVVGKVSLPYYLNFWIETENIFFLILAAVIFWLLFMSVLAFQWLLPVRSIMHNNFLKCVKKCYLLLIDNFGFTFALFLVNILNLALTVVTFGLVPGFNGIEITVVNALRLRLYKYDWIEVNPGMTKAERKDVPWDELLMRDKETLGPHPFKAIFKPWRS